MEFFNDLISIHQRNKLITAFLTKTRQTILETES